MSSEGTSDSRRKQISIVLCTLAVDIVLMVFMLLLLCSDMRARFSLSGTGYRVTSIRLYCSLTRWTNGSGTPSGFDCNFISPDLKMALRSPSYSPPNSMMHRGERIAFPLIYFFVAAVGIANYVGFVCIRRSKCTDDHKTGFLSEST